MKRWLGLAAVAMLLSLQSAVLAAQELKQFGRGSQQQIVSARAGKPFIVAFWSVNCTYCGAELAMFGKLLKKYPGLDLVLVSTDTPADDLEIAAVLKKHALDRAEVWVFADSHADRLRFEVDPEWYGELPRTYFHAAKEGVRAASGKIEQADVERWIERQQR
ncbi:MAG: redoxin domain-containing protein [Gallionella sp.]|jgi:thiol-disulfide isomerase/thioredoxin|nr:redoxin domain-containing protein [Gallionella sp.]MCK9353177.1 redoxin domain-containing protein [Gallionella sp.]